MIQGLLAKLTIRTVGIIALALLFAALLMWGPQACNNHFAAKTQGRLDKANVEAVTKTSEETLKTVDEAAVKAETVDQTVKESIDEIRKAPDGHSNDAALRSACRMRQYRNSERCARLREADTAKLEAGSSAR